MRLTILLLADPSNWESVLQDINLVAQIIGIIMIVFYVVYTYKTFRQIKKQTDYQQDAYLTVETIIMKDLQQQAQSTLPVSSLNERVFIRRRNSITNKYLNTEIPAKMTDILKPLFKLDDGLYEGNYYTLSFTNYGNAEVKRINVSLTIEISNSKELVTKKMLQEKETHKLKFCINELVARNGGKVNIPLIATASFPIYNITFKGDYFDFKNKKYLLEGSIIDGENTHFHSLPK
jgi:hypothetical protein